MSHDTMSRTSALALPTLIARTRWTLVVAGALSLLLPPMLSAANRLFIEPQTVQVGQTAVSVPIRLDNDQQLYGYSLSLVTQVSLLEIQEVNLAGTDYSAAEFKAGEILDAGARATWGVVLDISAPFDVDNVIPVGTRLHIANVVVDVTASAAGAATIQFQDVPSSNPQQAPDNKNILVGASGTPSPLTSTAGAITIQDDSAVTFKRGDSNGDDAVDISDAIYHLGFLFLGGLAPGCDDASDMDDSGVLDITDAIFLLASLFQGGPSPPPPFPDAGEDPTPDGLGCAVAP